jgi:hypothetical protein
MRPRTALAQVVGLSLAVIPSLTTCDLPPIIPVSTGSVNIGFIQVGGRTIRRATFEISGNGIDPVDGSIDLSDDAATPSAFVGALPEATGYTLELWAMTDDGQEQCYGTSSFDIAANQTATVEIGVVCTPLSAHTILVNGMADYCPMLASETASPSSGFVGGPAITLAASAHSYYSDPLQFSWQAPSGKLSSANAAVTLYTCAEAGVLELTVTVSDGNCPESAHVTVTCLPPPDAGPGLSDASRGEDGGML